MGGRFMFRRMTTGPRDLKKLRKGLMASGLTGPLGEGEGGPLTGRLKMGMGASDLGRAGGGPAVTSPSKWKPQPDWQAGRREPS